MQDPNPGHARARRRRTFASAIFALGCAASMLAACSDSGAERPTRAAPDAGAALYEQTCAYCHGSDLRGTERGPSHLSQVYAPDHHPDASFRSAITNGSPAHHWEFGDMPPVPGLDDDQIDAIIAYVREQQENEGFQPYPPR